MLADDTDVLEVTHLVVVVEAVADDEAVGNEEADIVTEVGAVLQVHLIPLVEEHARPDRLGALGFECVHYFFHGQARVKDVLEDEDVRVSDSGVFDGELDLSSGLIIIVGFCFGEIKVTDHIFVLGGWIAHCSQFLQTRVEVEEKLVGSGEDYQNVQCFAFIVIKNLLSQPVAPVPDMP